MKATHKAAMTSIGVALLMEKESRVQRTCVRTRVWENSQGKDN